MEREATAGVLLRFVGEMVGNEFRGKERERDLHASHLEWLVCSQGMPFDGGSWCNGIQDGKEGLRDLLEMRGKRNGRLHLKDRREK